MLGNRLITGTKMKVQNAVRHTNVVSLKFGDIKSSKPEKAKKQIYFPLL